MLIFTAAARDLIARAFDTYGDATERQIWARWSGQHRAARRGPNDPWDDGMPFDNEFAAAAVVVLRRLAIDKRERVDASLSEDDREDLDNELAYIRSVALSIREHPAPAQAA
jgi:hypothetical protein